MRSLNFEKKNPAIFQLLSDMEDTEDNGIDFEEFLDIMSNRISLKNNEEDMKKIFDLFDDEGN